jgi:hypothetical protein
MDMEWLKFTAAPALLGAVVLLAFLWPTRESGRRLLQRWGIASPVAPQITEAVRYLRQRRILTVLLLTVVPALLLLFAPDHHSSGDVRTPLAGSMLIAQLSAAMLIAELIATLRPVSGIRVASLDQRSWRDLVPSWALVVTAVLTVLAIGLAALELAIQPWVNRYGAALAENGSRDSGSEPDVRAVLDFDGWFDVLGVAICLVAVAAVVLLAVRRPSVSDPAVDTALRIRSGRVAVALGFGWLASLVYGAQSSLDSLGIASLEGRDDPSLPQPPGWFTDGMLDGLEIFASVVVVAALGCWILLAAPSRRSLARAR